MTSASAGSPLTLSLKVPSNADGWTPVPSAEVMPVTPPGRSLVLSSTLTPLVSSSVFLAAASAFAAAALSPLSPLSSPPQADRPARARPSTSGAAASRARPAKDSVTGSALHTPRSRRVGRGAPQPGSARARHGGDRLAPGHPGPVALAGRLGQVDRATAGRRSASRGIACPGRHEGVLALEEAVAAHASGGPALAGV